MRIDPMRMIRAVAAFSVLFLLFGCMQGPAREGSFSRELSVSGKVNLEVESGAGNVNVHIGPTQKVSIQARIRARGLFSGMSGDDKVRRIQDNPPVVQQGNTIRVGKISDSELRKNVFLDLDISVPPDTQVNCITGAGNVTLRGLQGPIRATTGAGIVSAEDLAGDVYLNSGAGNLDIRQVRGRLEANSGAGSIKASGSPKKDWRLSVGAGSIRVEVPGDASFELEAETGIGKVSLSPDFHLKSGSTTNSRVQGTVGNGGPMLRVNNGAGSIAIERGAERN